MKECLSLDDGDGRNETEEKFCFAEEEEKKEEKK